MGARAAMVAVTLAVVACGRVSRDDERDEASAGASGADGGATSTGGVPPDDPCEHPLEVADCHQHHASYAFNGETGYCQEVYDGGCHDTANRFPSLTACESTCGALPEPTCDDPSGRAGGCPCTTARQCAGDVCLASNMVPMDDDDCLSISEGVCNTYPPLLGCWCVLGLADLPDRGIMCWDGLEIE